jgi:predicted metal-dependent enzyme (double-stranded beta helix superfamily)
VFDLDAFVTDCRSALGEATPAVAVKELVERAISRPSDLDDALTPPTHGGFRTLHRSAELTVLQFVWPPHVVLFPHDHRMWAANGIYGGGEDNTFYRRTGTGIGVSGGRRLDAGDVALLGADAIHAVSNPYGDYTAAIHVYGGDYFATPRSQWDVVSFEEQPFNVEDVRRTLDEADARARDAEPGHRFGRDAAAPRPPAGADPEAGALHG